MSKHKPDDVVAMFLTKQELSTLTAALAMYVHFSDGPMIARIAKEAHDIGVPAPLAPHDVPALINKIEGAVAASDDAKATEREFTQ